MSYDKEEFSYYVGEWVDNEKHGKGYRQYPSGSTYDGQWKSDVRHGHGTMVWAGTGESYTGEWDMGIQVINCTMGFGAPGSVCSMFVLTDFGDLDIRTDPFLSLFQNIFEQ